MEHWSFFWHRASIGSAKCQNSSKQCSAAFLNSNLFSSNHSSSINEATTMILPENGYIQTAGPLLFGLDLGCPMSHSSLPPISRMTNHTVKCMHWAAADRNGTYSMWRMLLICLIDDGEGKGGGAISFCGSTTGRASVGQSFEAARM